VSPIDEFFERIKSEEQKELIYVLHDFFKAIPNVTCKLRYSTLFYDQEKWKVYLLANKDGSVDVSFLNAQDLNHPLLEDRGRKMVKSLNLQSLEDDKKWQALDKIAKKVFKY
jgi:hypothetical protein